MINSRKSRFSDGLGGQISAYNWVRSLSNRISNIGFLFHSHIHVLKCDYGFMNAFIDMGAIAMTGFFLLSGYVMDFTSRRKSFSDLREIKTFMLSD